MQLRTLFSHQLLFWDILIYFVFSVPKRKLGDAVGDTFLSSTFPFFFVFRHLRLRNQLQIWNIYSWWHSARTNLCAYFLAFLAFLTGKSITKPVMQFPQKLGPCSEDSPNKDPRVGKMWGNWAISDLFTWPGFCQSFALGIRLLPSPGHEISEWCQSAFAFLPSFFSKCCRSLRPLVRFEWPQSGLLGRTLKTPLEQLSPTNPWELPTLWSFFSRS